MKGPAVRSVFIGLVVSMMLMGAVAPFAAAAVTPNQTADATQNNFIDSDVEKAEHDMSAFGTGESGILSYFDDDGNQATLDAELDDEPANPVTYTPSHVDASDYNAFPRDSEDVSATDAANWTASSTNGAATVSDAKLGDAPAVNIDADLADTQTATYTFTDFTVDSDEEKRMLAIGGDVNEINSNTTVSIRAVDADGDYKEYTADSAQNASTDSVWASSTGVSKISQVRMGDLATQGSGDGSFDTIESVEIVVNDGNFDGSLSLINVEKKSAIDFGTTMVDDNDDGDKNTESDLTQPNGAVSVTGLDTLGSTFDSASLYGVSFNAHFSTAAADDEDSEVNFTSADQYQSYDSIATQSTRLGLEPAYDLSYSNSRLMGDVPLPEQRYLDAKYLLGAGDTEFSDLDDDTTWTENVANLFTGNEPVELATGINPGETVIVQTETLVTSDEKQEMMESPDEAASGGGFFGGSGDGPIQKYVLSPIGGAVAAILGFLGIKGRGS